ncbi:hypothetical protein [Moorella sp. Hama-1]|uniref:hypothetical protein n=1 Tax=Moorella sp. Hama-1 TaxID=2138101 RepID=UPI000D64660C|nr:hypothetical protein [Moorella sp. Hama-1]BCV23189.1 hypothetical protein hamaS1_32580 [Moorella sp. Hama-1]
MKLQKQKPLPNSLWICRDCGLVDNLLNFVKAVPFTMRAEALWDIILRKGLPTGSTAAWTILRFAADCPHIHRLDDYGKETMMKNYFQLLTLLG